MPDHDAPGGATRRAFIAGSAAAASALLLGPRNARAGKAKLTLKFATVAPPGTPWAKHVKRIKDRVEGATYGNVSVAPYLGGALGTGNATFESCRRGNIHIWAGATSSAANTLPELSTLELPFLIPSFAAADELLDVHLKSLIEAKLRKANLKLLFFSEQGYRSIGTNFGFVRGVSDLVDKKPRSEYGDVHLETWRALGASPVPVPVTEALTALQAGVVDGYASTPVFAVAASWHQAITHFTHTRHTYQPALAVMNLDVWNSLRKDVQIAIVGDPQREARFIRRRVRAATTFQLSKFKDSGVALHVSTASERAALRTATAPVHKKFADQYGDSLYKAITKHL